jgi:ABC-type branched-subunit amino acid transport system ATPase component
LLTLEKVNAFYDGSHILHQINLKVESNERISILGRNGAGKTTLLKSIMDAGPVVSGDITWNGEGLAGSETASRARKGLCLVPEDRRIFGHLTSTENLGLAARGIGLRLERGEIEGHLATFPMLVPLADRLGGTLSGGQQQILAIARALIVSPKLLLLDEPTEGLAPVIVQELAAVVSDVCRRSDMGVILCEQNMWFARQFTSRVVLLDSGRVVFDGDWKEFDSDEDLKIRHLVV